METFDGEIELTKAAFGVELARCAISKPEASPFEVAKSLGLPTALCLVASSQWMNDPITVDARKHEAALYIPNVPTKEEVAARLLAVSEARDTEPKEKIAALRLLAEMFEYIPKAPATQINNTNLNGDVHTVQNVIAIPERELDWEERLIEHQDKVIADARA